MPQLTSIVPTTELEAINAMLSVIGQAPIADQDAAVTAGNTDVIMAVNLLRNSCREVQMMGWRFNTEFGYQIMPTNTLSWTDNLGNVFLLNVFEWPSNLGAAEITQRPDQQGDKYIDFTMRMSNFYQRDSTSQLIFYDRKQNREGWDSTVVPYIYINPTWLFPYANIPEEARRFIFVRAARAFAQQAVGSQELAGMTQQDEAFALRQLKRAHGEDDDYNFLDSLDVLIDFGRRPLYTGVQDGRGTAGHA